MNQLKEAEKKASQLVSDARKCEFDWLQVSYVICFTISDVFSFSFLIVVFCFVFPARVDRMKEAKSEAEDAVAAYRAEMEAEYQKNVNKVGYPPFW